MPRASVTEENQALATTGWGFLSLHSGDPGTTGANELSGGGYARQAITWAAASGGSVGNAGTASFTTAGNVAVTYFGVWSAATGGTYYVGGALTAAVTATTITVAAGAITVSAS